MRCTERAAMHGPQLEKYMSAGFSEVELEVLRADAEFDRAYRAALEAAVPQDAFEELCRVASKVLQRHHPRWQSPVWERVRARLKE